MAFKIKNIKIKNNCVVAPMAGVTNLAYRLILKEFGAGLIYTEMISDKGLLYKNRRTLEMIKILDENRPMALQLFGSEVKSMVKAAKFIDEFSNADIIDINMGCPVSKVVKSGAGSALMKNPDLAFKIVQEIVKNVNKPVSVKIRSGWDHENINAVSFAKGLEKAGASLVAIHGRTRSDMYSGKVNLDIIKQVKENLNIPVIGNGDIFTPEDAKHMIDYTKVDAVMIGRGLLGNPWLVKQVIDYLDKGKYQKEIPYNERKRYIEKHLEHLVELKGEKIAVLEMRSHGAWYLKGIFGASKIKNLIVSCDTVQEIKSVINNYFDKLNKK